jgi:hypothetical protein
MVFADGQRALGHKTAEDHVTEPVSPPHRPSREALTVYDHTELVLKRTLNLPAYQRQWWSYHDVNRPRK